MTGPTSARGTLRHLGGMFRFGGPFSVAHAGLWALMHLLWLLPGLLALWFFNALTRESRAPISTNGIVALVVLLAVAQAGMWLLAGYVEIVFRFLISALLRRNLLRRILHRPGALALPFGVGETINRFRDDVDIAEDALDWTDEIIGQGLIVLSALAVLLRTDAVLTVAVVAPLVVVILVAQRANAALGRLRVASSQAGSEVSGALGDLLAGVDTLRAAGAEGRAVDRLRRLNARRRQLTVRDRVAAQVLNAVTQNLTGVGTALIMLLAAGRLRSGDLTAGDFVLFVSFLGFVTGYVAALGQYLVVFRQSSVAFDRLGELMGGDGPGLTARADLHLRGPLPDGAPLVGEALPPERDLTVSGLTYRHPGGGAGIDDVDLSLTPGSMTVITGRVGAGKTTLVRAILGLLPAASGTVRWGGVRLDDPATSLIPPNAAYVPQSPTLFGDTLLGNVLLGIPSGEAQVGRATGDAMLDHDLAGFPAGLDTPVGRRGVTLSGGQVQRVAVARALVREPALLVVDDVSSALDAGTERDIWRRLRERRDVTVLAVSHRRAALLAANRIVVLREGRVDAEGTIAELLATSVEFRAIWQQADDEPT